MEMSEVVQEIAALTNTQDLFVGMRSSVVVDEWYNTSLGKEANSFWPNNLGSVSPTALGLALALPHRRIIALDTDGSLLMNLGILCTIGSVRPKNLTIFVMDNGVYQSIGGPPTLTSRNTDIARLAEGAGCINCSTATDLDTFANAAQRVLTDEEFGLVVAKVAPRERALAWRDRRRTDGVEDKYRFIRYVEQLENIVIHSGIPGSEG